MVVQFYDEVLKLKSSPSKMKVIKLLVREAIAGPLSLLVVIAVVVSFLMPVAAYAAPAMPIGITSRAGATEAPVAVFVVPASSVPGVVGARVESLLAAVCVDGRTVYGAIYILPRAILRTSLIPGNTTILLPVLEDSMVKPSDILVVMLPLPAAQPIGVVATPR